jgi:hypothetical protein
MTTEQKIARRKLSLLELAPDLGNVSKARKVMGYSRQQYYDIRRNFQTYGTDGLIDRLPGPRNQHPNRVPEAEARPGVAAGAVDRGLQIDLADALQHDEEGVDRDQSAGVRRRDVALAELRAEALQQPDLLVGEADLLGDAHRAVAGMRQSVLQEPCQQTTGHRGAATQQRRAAGLRAAWRTIEAVLSDKGPEFGGREDQHPHELFLRLEGIQHIQHKRTRVSRPQSTDEIE